MRKLVVVVGTRPNFVKVAGFPAELTRRPGWNMVLVHTGQHDDAAMSEVFLQEFGLVPDHVLGAVPNSPVGRLAHIVQALEPVLLEEAPDLVMVVGDVDGTLAAALCAERLGLPIAHLESGLRNGDRTMPEETNRILTDRISTLCFVTEESGLANLRAEGIAEACMHFVGNTMIDTLARSKARIEAHPVIEELGLGAGQHVLVTMHRPSTVDHPVQLALMIELVAEASVAFPVVLPLHPRTAERLQAFGLMDRLRMIPDVTLCGPLDYLAFQKLLATSVAVITDSGGVQEESTWLGVPCLTLRDSTERPVTVEQGSNELIAFTPQALRAALEEIRRGRFKQSRIPALWDGQATKRVFDVLDNW